MPSNPKLFIRNSPLFITTRVEEGLPLVPGRLMNYLLGSIMARARSLYAVRLCHFVFMSNHLHLLLVVEDPEHVDDFMRYVKGESSHAVNRILGRRKHTIWCEGYDSPVVLTVEDVLRYVGYIYTNPQRAGLVRTMDDYPGLSSWGMYKSRCYRTRCKWVRRVAVPSCVELSKLPGDEQERLISEIEESSAESHELILEPDAWLGCFGLESRAEEFRERVFLIVSELELELGKERDSVVGPEMLQSLEVGTSRYIPKKFSRRMLCLCSDRELRRGFIELFRYLQGAARQVFQAWKQGVNPRASWPPGMLAPGGYAHASLCPWVVCFV